ncbi:MAG: hypothetical protein IJH14_05910 [Solobacterium sp.]|nr:hypothetical protein [Solobacterium sp.]
MGKHKILPDTDGWTLRDRLAYRLLTAFRYADLPEKPKIGKGYEYWPQGAVTAENRPTYGCIRLGKENKLMLSFCGGGVSFDAYTAARPNKSGNRDKQNFYAVEAETADILLRTGTNGRSKKNPFHDWTVVVLPYTTGDFHCGRNDYPYTDLNGNSQILRHHGYINYKLLLKKVRELVPDPEKLIITGFSAGAFGTALLADDIIGEFPNCHDTTVICDSAMMHNNWQKIAREVWGAPEEICARLTGTEIVTDSLIALHNRRPEVKIMYCCSSRDCALTQYVSYLEEDGNWHPTKETGDRFQKHLADMSAALMAAIPEIGLFYFDKPDIAHKEADLTVHCILAGSDAFTVSEGGITAAEWMEKGVNGEMLKLGLEHLRENQI